MKKKETGIGRDGMTLQKIWKSVKNNWVLYLFLLPTLIYVGVFSYAPMYGIQVAFKDFVPSKGIWGSP